MATPKPNKECDACLERDIQEIAVKFCKQCSQNLCRGCGMDHKNNTATKQHDICSIESASATNPKAFFENLASGPHDDIKPAVRQGRQIKKRQDVTQGSQTGHLRYETTEKNIRMQVHEGATIDKNQPRHDDVAQETVQPATSKPIGDKQQEHAVDTESLATDRPTSDQNAVVCSRPKPYSVATAETARYSPMELSGSDSGSDMDVDDQMNEFVKKVFSKIYDNVLNYLEPVPVLDVFQSEQVFAENTTVRVRGLREQPDTSSKNREIHKYFKANPDKYVTFKSALVRTGQSGLLEKIEMTEAKLHEATKEGKHGCHCTDPSNCPLLTKIKCPENLTPFLSSEILQLVETVFDRNYDNILEDLEPVKVLDVFQAEKVLGKNTNVQVRDIRDKPDTSSKIREIHKYIRANPDKYVAFKSALVMTEQSGLLKKIEMTEAEFHVKLKGEARGCNCTDSSICPLLKEIKCPENLKPFLPSEIARVQNQLIELYEDHCQRVPLYPLTPNRTTRVEDLYVKPKLLLESPSGRQKDSDSRDTGAEIRVKNIKDIFYSGDKLCKRIIVNGDAGKGKTSLCEHLVSLWVRCHTGKMQLSGDEDFMTKFTFLFYVSLRDANRDYKVCYRVSDMIVSQLQLEDCNVLKLMLEYSCLIILDGLDELTGAHASTRFGSPNLPVTPRSDKCVYVTTSRPFKLELLARDLEGKIDRQIAIVGLEQQSQKVLADKVVSLLNSKHGENKSADQFLSDIKRQKLTQYLETPVLLMQMVGLWHSGKSLGNSQCAIYSSIIEKQIEFTEKVRGMPKEQSYEEVCQDEFPPCLANQPFCQKYKAVLLKVCKLAYERLLDKNQENSLIFNHEQTEICGMNDAEVKQLLHMGILTQHKVFGKIVEELKSVSFLHKSHQEFFCAVHLSTKCQRSELSKQLSEVICDLDRALELEKIFLFVCGMNANVAADISEFLMEKVSSDARVQEYRQELGQDGLGLIKRIQAIILAGSDEARQNQQSTSTLTLHDIFVESEHDASKIFACNTLHAKSILMYAPDDVTSWPPSSCLEKISLSKADITECDVFTENFDCSTLSVLNLENITMIRDQINGLSETLSSSQNIKQVRIEDVSCEDDENDENIRLDFSRHKKLESLQIGDVNVEEINLSPEENLKEVRLEGGVCISAAVFRDTMKSLPRNGVKIRLGYPGPLKLIGEKELIDMGGVFISVAEFRETMKTLPRLGIFGPLKVRGAKEAKQVLENIRQAEHTQVVWDDVEYGDDVCAVNWFEFFNNL